MHKSNRMKKVSENIEVFLTLVEKVTKKKQLRDHLISLTMKHILKTNDCEIFIEQVGGRIGSISKVRNDYSSARKSSRKPKIKKRQRKTINEGAKYFMDRIHKAQRNRKIEAIILEHNFERRVTDLFLATKATDN